MYKIVYKYITRNALDFFFFKSYSTLDIPINQWALRKTDVKEINMIFF